MADDIIQPIPEAAVPSGGGMKAFLGTTGGKLVVGGAAVGVLAVVAVVVAVVVLLGASKPDVNNDVVPITPASSFSTSTPGGDGEEATTVPPAVPDSEVFTFRDVFKPLIAKAVEGGQTPAEPGSSETSTTAGEADTLYLQSVTVEDGTDKAVLTLNGAEYILAEGEVVGGTPWKVLTIEASSDSVVMLYGDSQITLTVGQGTDSGK